MKEIEQNKNIRLCYFMVKTNKGIGYICMALERPEKDSDSNQYKAGFSFCSPQEGMNFSKKKAREMALGRLLRFDRLAARGDEYNRIAFTSDAKNINQVFTDGLLAAETFKVKSHFDEENERVMSEWAVPNWVRRRKALIFGLNVNSPNKKEI